MNPIPIECASLASGLASLRAQLSSLQDELKKAAGQDKSDILQQIKDTRSDILKADANLKKCIQEHPGPSLEKAPQNILEIVHKNPNPPSDPNWAKTPDNSIPLLPATFPFPPSEKEWKQVLAPDEEYDQDLAGASGWVINPRPSGADVPFTHPFGTDWEFEFALDQPEEDPTKYTSLLASGNKEAKSEHDSAAIALATELQIPVPEDGLLGVEWDGNLVPQSFQKQVTTGDRVAVFGRWILDTGHDFNGSLRTEIHPPLLMAAASIQPKSDNSQATRVLFTSRPYLVGQTFILDLDHIYDDNAEDDGHLFYHLAKETAKVNTAQSFLVEAHPKIKSHPFRGVKLLHFVIRPPSRDFGPFGIYRLAISFHFTVRSGCAVQVNSTAQDSVDVFVALSDAGYIPPSLPTRRGIRKSREELNKLDPDSGTGYEIGEAMSAGIQYFALGGPIGPAVIELLLERGVETDEYDPLPEINVLDATNAVIDAFASEIPAGKGITVNNDQPYPIYGWLEAKWVKSNVVGNVNSGLNSNNLVT